MKFKYLQSYRPDPGWQWDSMAAAKPDGSVWSILQTGYGSPTWETGVRLAGAGTMV